LVSDGFPFAVAALVVMFVYSPLLKPRPLLGNMAWRSSRLAAVYGALALGAPAAGAVPWYWRRCCISCGKSSKTSKTSPATGRSDGARCRSPWAAAGDGSARVCAAVRARQSALAAERGYGGRTL